MMPSLKDWALSTTWRAPMVASQSRRRISHTDPYTDPYTGEWPEGLGRLSLSWATLSNHLKLLINTPWIRLSTLSIK